MKKYIAMLLISLLMCNCFACSEATGDTVEESTQVNATEEAQEYTYVSEYVELGFELAAGEYMSGVSMQNGLVIGIVQGWDFATETSNMSIYTYDANTGITEKTGLDCSNKEASIRKVFRTIEGGWLVLLATYTVNEITGELTIVYEVSTFDETGTELQNVVLDAFESVEFSQFAVDFAGNMYLVSDKTVHVLRADGSNYFEIIGDAYIQSMATTEDGRVYYTAYEDELMVYFIDENSQSVGATYTGKDIDSDMQIDGDMNAIYVMNNACALYNFETSEIQELFDWLDLDISAAEINSVCQLEDGRIAAIYQEYPTMDTGLILIEEVPSSEIPVREELVLATLELGFGAKNDIIDFNRNNSEYRIVVKDDYEDVGALYMDLISDNPPDMIELGTYSVKTEMLVEKGALEELTPYLEDAGYAQEDFVPSILELCKVGDGLYYVPQDFTIQTMFADAALVGDEMSWTFSEALDVMKNLPDDMKLSELYTKSSFMAYMLISTMDQFIDVETNRTMFDSEEFKALLELANLFPEEYVYVEMAPTQEDAIRMGTLLLYDGFIRDLDEITKIFTVFGDKEATAIGLPGVEGCGATITFMNTPIAVSAQSEYKDIAAQFVISSLEPLDESVYALYASSSPYGFPVLQDSFDALIQEELWLEHVTQQEVDLLMELVNNTTLVANYSYNDLGVIVLEEAVSYFAGGKTTDEVIDIIQNRANLYLAEQE